MIGLPLMPSFFLLRKPALRSLHFVFFFLQTGELLIKCHPIQFLQMNRQLLGHKFSPVLWERQGDPEGYKELKLSLAYFMRSCIYQKNHQEREQYD